MSLFPEIDFNKTAEYCDNFLRNDFKRAVRMAGYDLIDLKSPALSSAPAPSNGMNNVEDRLVAGLTAEGIAKAGRQSMYHCFKTSRIILVALYLDELSPGEVARKVKYEHSQYSVLKRRALNEFADRYEYWERKYNCYPIIDLHIYKKVNRQSTGNQPAKDRQKTGN